MPLLNDSPVSPILIEDSDEQSNSSQLLSCDYDIIKYYAKTSDAATATQTIDELPKISDDNSMKCDHLNADAMSKTINDDNALNEIDCDGNDDDENSGANEMSKVKLIYSCHRCNGTFSSRLTFEAHYKQAYNEAPVYTCQMCQKQMKNRRSYQRHFNRHTNAKEYKCEICSKTFSVEKLYKQHSSVHNLSTAKTCAECQLEFFDLYEFKAHCRTEHSQKKEPEKWQCNDCGKVMKNRSSLGMHMKIHKNDRQFCCSVCDQKFVQKINLINHVKAHNAIKTHSCQECGKSFVGQSQLLRHHTYHTNVRTFECEICKKLYKTKRDLKLHLMVHSVQRPHRCSQCEKTFLSTSKLKQHLNIHTGSRPYKCDYCPKDFTNFPNWLKHTRRRHKVDHKTGEKLVVMPKFLNKDKKTTTENIGTKKNGETKRKKPTKKAKSESSATELSKMTTINVKREEPLDICELITDVSELMDPIHNHHVITSTIPTSTATLSSMTIENFKETMKLPTLPPSTDLSTITVNDKTLPLNTSDDLERAASLLMQQNIDLEDEIEFINIKSESIDTSFYHNSFNFFAPNEKSQCTEPVDFQSDHLLSSIDSSSLYSYYSQAQSTQCDFAMLPLPPINTVKSKIKTIDPNLTHIYTSTANVL